VNAPAAAAFTTGRLAVRALASADETLYCGIYTDARLMRHVGRPLAARQAQISFHAAVAAAGRQPLRHVYFGLRCGTTGSAVGVCALRDIGLRAGQAEIGLMLRREAHASGLASEALDAVARWGFSELGLETIYGCADPANLAASRLARRAGFLLVEDGAGGAAASGNLFVRHRPVPGPSTSH
jgi:ribosomal-protein-alanine N-acetyltransferase